MSRSHASAGGHYLSTSDELALIFGVPVLIGLGLFSPGVLGRDAADWLMEHRILAPSSDAVIPLLGGTGLAWPHLSIVVGVLILLIAKFSWRGHHHRGATAAPATGGAA